MEAVAVRKTDADRARALVEARAAELERAANEIGEARFRQWLRERAKAVRMQRAA